MFVQILISGLTLGSLYGLVAMGFTLVFKATEVFNFAYGMLVVCGAYIAYTLIAQLNLPFGLSIAALLVVSALLGVLVHALIIRPLSGRPMLPVVMATLALAMALRALIELIYGSTGRTFVTPMPTGVFMLGDVRISNLHLVAAVVSWVCMGAFAIFFRYTPAGLLMRATADSHEAALACGINTTRVNRLAWAIGAILAGIGGLFMGQIQWASVEVEHILMLVLPAVVIGGLQSIPGAVIGGLLVGLIEQFSAYYISPKATDVMVYVPLLLILLVRPWGLLGHRELGRV